ncbi:MAG: hypothetical protein WHT84_04510, partial [Breznakiellaceae bacterium]
MNQKEKLLESLARVGSFGAKSENIEIKELTKRTLIIPGHLQALDPNILLIIGGRGSGKSHLFHLLSDSSVIDALIGETSNSYLKLNSLWFVGYSSSLKLFPPQEIMADFVQKSDKVDLISFWKILTLSTFLGQKREANPLYKELISICERKLSKNLLSLLTGNLSQLRSWFPVTMKEIEVIGATLDDIDE